MWGILGNVGAVWAMDVSMGSVGLNGLYGQCRRYGQRGQYVRWLEQGTLEQCNKHWGVGQY